MIDADFNVTVVTQSSSLNPKDINGAIFVTSDYTYESLVKIFTGQDAVVSAVAAGPPIAAQKVMIDAASQAGSGDLFLVNMALAALLSHLKTSRSSWHPRLN